MSEEPKGVWGTNGGIYLGYETDTTEGDENTPRSTKQLRYVGDRHLMTIGPNGSGKSRRLLLPNLAQLTGWSMVVVDPKAELCAMTREYREQHGAHTIILNPFDVLGLGSDGFNPVAALDPDSVDFPDDALTLAEAMIRIEGRDPHWGASAQDLVTALIMYSRLVMDEPMDLKYEPPPKDDAQVEMDLDEPEDEPDHLVDMKWRDDEQERGSLNHVRLLLGKPSRAMALLAYKMKHVGKERKCYELVVKAGRFMDINPENRELSSIVSTALTQTRWLDSRPIKEDLRKLVPHDFANLKNEPTTVYLILPARRLGSHSTWMRLMIAAIVNPLLVDTKKAKVPVMLMLDEYPALAQGGFPIIERNMAMFRGYGIKLWTVFQDLTQAMKLYGRDGWESFAGNAGVLQSFAPQDVATAKYLSDRMPLRLMRADVTSTSFGGNQDKNGSPQHSQSTNDKPVPWMLPQHLRNMDKGFSILFTHLAKGPLSTYLPFRVTDRGYDEIYKLDPAD